ncbi:MAG: hypothetical protein H0U09_03505 [Geodermatophilaceae bacterium]|nr:hypothetical protein [Geodermatophilaceae bacterium]
MSSAAADVADAHVALLVAESNVVLTSDEPQIVRLLNTPRVNATIELF